MAESWIQTITILASFAVGFSFLLNRMEKMNDKIADMDKRLTAIETIFMMMGYTLKKTGTEEKK